MKKLLIVCLVGLCSMVSAQTLYEAEPVVETAPIHVGGDNADDPAVWIHPSDPAQSAIIGTCKHSSLGGLYVYNLDGTTNQFVQCGMMNNVDLRYNFPLGASNIDLVVSGDRSSDTLKLFRMNPSTRKLEAIGARNLPITLPDDPSYGFCMYHSETSGKYYGFVGDKSGGVEQWEFYDNGSNQVDGTMVRTFDADGQCEGMVADDELGFYYIAEEDADIWKYSAEPDGGTSRVSVAYAEVGQPLVPDIEGLTIYYGANGGGYLLVSSQGEDAPTDPYASTFAVYERGGSNEYVMSFKVVAANGIDKVTKSDGIDVCNTALNSVFSNGVFVTHDTVNTGTNVNFKLVPWEAIASAPVTNLLIDTAWNPRAVGLDAAPEFTAQTVHSFSSDILDMETGEFNPGHDGPETAVLLADRSVWEVHPGSPWEAFQIAPTGMPTLDFVLHPTLEIADVHSGSSGNEIVLCGHPRLGLLRRSSEGTWSSETLMDVSMGVGQLWSARAGELDGGNSADELIVIRETVMDFSEAYCFQESAGSWSSQVVYSAEVGMDAVVCDINTNHAGNEVIITTEMGPTYELRPDGGSNEWPKTTIWDDFDHAGWQVRAADIDPAWAGNELAYATRYSGKIALSRPLPGGAHDLDLLFTASIGILDIAVDEIFFESDSLEIAGTALTSACLAWKTNGVWTGAEIAAAPSNDLFHTVCSVDADDSTPGTEILLGTKNGSLILLTRVLDDSQDTDGDGLPDWWETFYFGGATNANPAATASNGLNSVLETYVAGLEPTDSNDFFLISDFSVESETVIHWTPAVSGRRYAVSHGSNLLEKLSLIASNLPPTGVWTDSVHGAENVGIYRLGVELEP